jgi:hypothetical protein
VYFTACTCAYSYCNSNIAMAATHKHGQTQPQQRDRATFGHTVGKLPLILVNRHGKLNISPHLVTPWANFR